MKLLIDSHILVWLLYEPERFKPAVRDTLSSADIVYVSSVSLWELALKHATGKLRYTPEALAAGVDALGLVLLPLMPEHAVALTAVKLPHKDPFDRMLVAQAKAEGCTLVTADETILSTTYSTLKV